MPDSASAARSEGAAERQRVLILFGGRSAEHEISVISGGFITASLDRERFEPLLVGISKQGQWHLVDEDKLSPSKNPDEVSVDDSGPRVWLLPMPDGRLHIDGRAPIAFDVRLPGPAWPDGRGRRHARDPRAGLGALCRSGRDRLCGRDGQDRDEADLRARRSAAAQVDRGDASCVANQARPAPRRSLGARLSDLRQARQHGLLAGHRQGDNGGNAHARDRTRL